jgi:hypothetical protein
LFLASADCCLWLISLLADQQASLVVDPNDLASSASALFPLAKVLEPEPRQARCAVAMIPGGNVAECHYSVKELAQNWGLSQAMVRRMLRNEPGVQRFGPEKKGHQRAYVTLRIPASVAERVYRRCTCPGLKPSQRGGTKKEAA